MKGHTAVNFFNITAWGPQAEWFLGHEHTDADVVGIAEHHLDTEGIGRAGINMAFTGMRSSWTDAAATVAGGTTGGDSGPAQATFEH